MLLAERCGMHVLWLPTRIHFAGKGKRYDHMVESRVPGVRQLLHTVQPQGLLHVWSNTPMMSAGHVPVHRCSRGK